MFTLSICFLSCWMLLFACWNWYLYIQGPRLAIYECDFYLAQPTTVLFWVGRKERGRRQDVTIADFLCVRSLLFLLDPQDAWSSTYPTSSCAHTLCPVCLGADGFCLYHPHYHTLSQLRYTLLTLVLGEIQHSGLKWFVLEPHKAVMEPRGKGISWLLPGSIVLSWIKPSRSLILAWVDDLPVRNWPVGEKSFET